MCELITSVQKPFGSEVPDDSQYSPVKDKQQKIEYFPAYPSVRSSATYKVIHAKVTKTECRKESQNHPRLTPGLFTVFCPHGVCLGFQVMLQCESPATAFDVLLRRFDPVPPLVIYDNCCKLHLYCLIREPKRFQGSRFLVDRLHYRVGHVGCSLGYSMDSYNMDPAIKVINSQVVEQANAGLRRLQTQLTFMTPANVIQHTATYLAIKNMDKKSAF